MIEGAAIQPVSSTIPIDQPVMFSESPVGDLAASMPSAPVHPLSSELLRYADLLRRIDMGTMREALSNKASAAMVVASRWHRTLRAWLRPHILRLRQIDVRALLAALSRVTATVATTTLSVLHALSMSLVSVARRLGQVNPRVAAAIMSFAAFAVLLPRVSAEHQDEKETTAVTPMETVTQIVGPAMQLSEEPEPPVVAARIVDAPSHISSSCSRQAWPYVTGACLTVAKGQAQPENLASESSALSGVVEQKAPIAASSAQPIINNAQAMMSPQDPLSAEDDKPPRRHEAVKRHRHESRRHAGVERKRRVAHAARESEATAFVPLAASNAP